MAGDPAAVSWGPGRLDVFARTAASSLLHVFNNGGAWQSETIAADLISAPGAASWGRNRLDVFARSAANTLVHISWNGSWSGWETLPGTGTFVGAPDAVSWGPNRIDIAFRNSTNNIRMYAWTENLQVPAIAQQQSNWCWAACGAMITHTFGVNVSQCSQAGGATGRIDCCNSPTPAACNVAGWTNYGWLGFTASNTSDSVPLTLAQVKDQLITKGKPFTFSWLWAGGATAHMMVAADYLRFANQDWIVRNDPAGGVQSLITYTDFVSAADHTHYRDYYDITYTKTKGDIMVARSQGNRFRAGTRWSDWFCIDGDQCELADVNGDGRKDAIAFTHTGPVYVGLSNGSGFGPKIVWNWTFCYGAEKCRVGDVNGDGKDDLIVYNTNGTAIVSLATGTGFGPNTTWHTGFCYGAEDCQIADVTGDKKADAIVFSGAVVIVSPSTGRRSVPAIMCGETTSTIVSTGSSARPVT